MLLLPLLPLLLPGPSAASAADAPRRVLIVHSFGEQFEPLATAAATFRTQLSLRSPVPIEYYDVSLETARFEEGTVGESLAGYVEVLGRHRPLDLVVPVGAPALRFCSRYREEVLDGTPMLVCGIEDRLGDPALLGPEATAVTFQVDLPGVVAGILETLPGTRRIAVVFGATPLERYWAEECRRQWTAFEDRVEFVWFDRTPFRETLDRIPALPPDSVVLLAVLYVDAAGVPYEQNEALHALHERAGRPVFGLFEPQLGHGILGGPLVDTRGIGLEAALLAVRILGGESPQAIGPHRVPLTPPRFDARELERWGIPADRLPEGSEILFVSPSSWSMHGGRILAVAGAAAVEAVLVFFLLANWRRLRSTRARLRENEQKVADLRRVLRHADRVSLLGQVTATLSHQLGQPLGAILRNSEAAGIFMATDDPDLEEVRAILHDVHRDGERAVQIIDRLRSLLEGKQDGRVPLVWDRLVRDTVFILQGDARGRKVRLHTETAPDLPLVLGDRVQLQQVLLNLAANAMDALGEAQGGVREVTVRARSTGNGFVECAVSDTGPGIPPGEEESIFDPFHTTKAHGMGMGLAISRTIVEAHGGTLWVDGGSRGGATFRFTVPVVPSPEVACLSPAP